MYTVIIFGAGVWIGLTLNKQGTKVNEKWVALKKWFRNLVRDKVK